MLNYHYMGNFYWQFFVLLSVCPFVLLLAFFYARARLFPIMSSNYFILLKRKFRVQKNSIKVELRKAKAQTKEKLGRLCGFFFALIMCCTCIVLINILSAVFDSELTNKWLITFGMALFQDFLIAQPLKCLIIYCIALCIYSGGISPTKDQCLRWIGNNVAGRVIALIN